MRNPFLALSLAAGSIFLPSAQAQNPMRNAALCTAGSDQGATIYVALKDTQLTVLKVGRGDVALHWKDAAVVYKTDGKVEKFGMVGNPSRPSEAELAKYRNTCGVGSAAPAAK